MIVFFGPVGSGKSTQGQMLAKKMDWQWVSTGNMFRASNDPEVQEILAKGQLVSSEKTCEVLAAALDEINGEQIILDGFPRRKDQAVWLVNNQEQHNYKVDLVVKIDVPVEEIIARLSSRGRTDDDPEVIKERMAIYDGEVEPILNHLMQSNVPIEAVNGVGTEEQIHERIMALVVGYKLG